jgi:signal transduction histidine kinase
MVSAWSLVALAIVGYPSSVPSQILIVGAYSLGSHAKGWRAPAGLAAMELGVGVVAVVGLPDASTGNLVLAGITYAAAFIFGWAMRTRRLYLEQLEERAALLEREHDEAAKRAVADERLRIAQELHDVVAHSMGVIAVHAGVGIHVIDSDPREAKQSLEAISRTSRGTLTEIRRLLGVLRADDGAAYEPAPGLGDLGRLVTDVATAGLPVDLQFDGTPVEVPPGVDLTAYRIVQEALTNVLKHAGDARATVVVGYEPAALRLEVRDDGLGPNGRADANGHGIVGMRERVAVYGGTLEVGARPGGGFRVVARLPYGEDR